MVGIGLIEARLAQLRIRLSSRYQPEVHELQNILMDDEEIEYCVSGHYMGGSALLVATDQRLLLVDKKLLFLTVEDIRYDMITEVDYGSSLMHGTVNIFTINKEHFFSCRKYKKQLRDLTAYVQQRVMETRNYVTQQNGHMPDEPKITSSVPDKYFIKPSRIITKARIGQLATDRETTTYNPYAKASLMTRRKLSRFTMR